jgi:predicted homoserine dehydrogenase-like protein
MILVDSALAERAAKGAPPIRIGMIGAGFMGRQP